MGATYWIVMFLVSAAGLPLGYWLWDRQETRVARRQRKEWSRQCR
jgi:hypothetical protein